MKSLQRRADHDEILDRLRRLRADTPRRWGRMTAPQMIAHLTDAFRNQLGERPRTKPAGAAPLLGRTLVKWTALYAPVRWPRGLLTPPDVDQEIGGTPPGADFAAEVAALVAATERFLSAGARGPRSPHFMFGSLSEWEWSRWACLHMDHHLRQFGV